MVTLEKTMKNVLLFSDFYYRGSVKRRNRYHFRNQRQKLHRMTYVLRKKILLRKIDLYSPSGLFFLNFGRGPLGVNFSREKFFRKKHVSRCSLSRWFRICYLFCVKIELLYENLRNKSTFFILFSNVTTEWGKNSIFSTIKQKVKKVNGYFCSPCSDDSNEIR